MEFIDRESIVLLCVMFLMLVGGVCIARCIRFRRQLELVMEDQLEAREMANLRLQHFLRSNQPVVTSAESEQDQITLTENPAVIVEATVINEGESQTEPAATENVTSTTEDEVAPDILESKIKSTTDPSEPLPDTTMVMSTSDVVMAPLATVVDTSIDPSPSELKTKVAPSAFRVVSSPPQVENKASK